MRLPWFIGYPLVGALWVRRALLAANSGIYYPSRYPKGRWETQAPGGGRRRVGFAVRATGCGCTRGGSIRPGARLATLFLHGNARQTSATGGPHIEALVAAGSAVLMLDYRGYGKSGGPSHRAGLCNADAEAGYEHLRGLGRPVVVHGESLGTGGGGGPGLPAPPARGLVLESALHLGPRHGGQRASGDRPAAGFSVSIRRARSSRSARPCWSFTATAIRWCRFKLGPRALRCGPRAEGLLGPFQGADHNDLVETAGNRVMRALARVLRFVARRLTRLFRPGSTLGPARSSMWDRFSRRAGLQLLLGDFESRGPACGSTDWCGTDLGPEPPGCRCTSDPARGSTGRARARSISEIAGALQRYSRSGPPAWRSRCVPHDHGVVGGFSRRGSRR